MLKKNYLKWIKLCIVHSQTFVETSATYVLSLSSMVRIQISKLLQQKYFILTLLCAIWPVESLANDWSLSMLRPIHKRNILNMFCINYRGVASSKSHIRSYMQNYTQPPSNWLFLIIEKIIYAHHLFGAYATMPEIGILAKLIRLCKI